MERNLKKVTENTGRKEVFKVMHDKVEIINDFNTNKKREARIIFYNQKIYVILYRDLNFEELKWLNFYILIYGNQNYGKNTFFEFKLNKNNLIYHSQVWDIIENKKFKSESISLLIKALSIKAGV